MLGVKILQAAQGSLNSDVLKGWKRKVKLTILASTTPSVVEINETVLPSEMFDSGDANSAQRYGEDIRVTADESGSTMLPHVVSYFRSSATSGERKALIHVKPGAATDLWIWYGNASVGSLPENDAYGANNVWSAELVMPIVPDRVSQDLSGHSRDGKPGILGGFNSSVIFNGTSEYAAWPSLTKAANGDLLCAFRRGASAHAISTDGYVSVHSSSDNGATWSELSTINKLSSSADSRDPNLLVRSNGDVWCVYTERTNVIGDVVYRVSSDNGSTWGSEQTVVSGTYQSRGKPVELANGDIILSLYNWSGTNVSYYYKWDGSSWSSSTIASGYNETSLLQDQTTQSTLYAFLRGVSSNIYRSVSTDNGSTWSTPSSVLTVSTTVPAEVQWRDNGDLILCYADQRNNALALALRSTDKGVTFSSIDKARIAQDGSTVEGLNGGGFYPSFTALSDNLYGVAFYYDTDPQSSPTKILFRLFRVDAIGRLVSYTDLGTPENGVRFDGTSNYIDNIGNEGSFKFIHETGTFTIRGVLKLTDYTANATGGLLVSVASSVDKGFALAYDNRSAASATKQLRMFITKGVGGTPIIDARSSINTITDNNEHLVHVTGNGTSGEIKFYVDGVLVNSVSGYSSLGSGNATRVTNIGRWNHSSPFGYLDGYWSRCAVYSTTMSSTEIAAEYDNWSSMSTFWEHTATPK